MRLSTYDAATMADQWIYVVRPQRADFVKTRTPIEQKIVAAHFEYLTELLHASKLVMAGPCLDGAFGIVVLRTADEAEARALMGSDPAVQAGVFSAELHPFRVSLYEKTALS